MRKFLIRLTVAAMVAAFAPALPVTSVQAAESTGTGISYTLEGCRASTDAYLAGTYVCPDANYTTGNLGKGWNEFDYVPGRVTVGAGNSAPTSQTFSFVVAVDSCSGTGSATSCSGYPGYDRLSVPALNGSLSTGTCDTTPTVSGPQYRSPGIGGTGTTLFRTVTIDGQSKNSRCVYDFYARLAFNSHLYPGSSLHFNLANTDLGTQGIGAKDVSIPVAGILPPEFSKSQTSSRGSSVVWAVRKSSTPANVAFSQTCPPSVNPQSQPVTVTVSWTKVTSASGDVTVVATLVAKNNAHRAVNLGLSDQLFEGADPATGTASGAAKSTSDTLAAGEQQSYTDTWSVSGSTATAFSDRATATFSDAVEGDVMGTLTRTASSSVDTLDPTSGATATVQDVESMTGDTAFDFVVTSVDGTAGSFANGYVLGGHTRSVTWNSGTLSDSGSTTFHKLVYANSPTAGSATLGDVATISPDGQSTSQATASSAITGAATVSIVISKTMNLVFDTAKTFTFNASGTDGSSGSTTVTIPAGTAIDPGTGVTPAFTGTISNLHPGVAYTITEPATAPFAAKTLTATTVTLPSCSTTKNVENTAAPSRAQVQKITVPNPAPTGATSWTFTLTGVQADGTTAVSNLSGGASEVVDDTANDGAYTTFSSNLDQDGATYYVTETAKTNWDLTSVVGDLSGTASRVGTSIASRTCSFTLNLTTDSGKLLSCTFTNTERSRVRVIKTENGGVPTHAYSFRLTGPYSYSQTLVTSTSNGGVLDFGYLRPGSYTLCELAVPAATTSTLQTSYGGTLNTTTGDVCLPFTLAAGVDRDFAIDNSYPGGGQRTIGYWKHWNTYTLGSTATTRAARTGNHLMDEFLPQPLGVYYTVTTAYKGVQVLSSASSKYAENQLAAQLLAAELNKAAGASICSSVNSAITTGNNLLTQVHYVGPPSYLVGSTHPLRSQFLSTANLLDRYNNGLVC